MAAPVSGMLTTHQQAAMLQHQQQQQRINAAANEPHKKMGGPPVAMTTAAPRAMHTTQAAPAAAVHIRGDSNSIPGGGGLEASVGGSSIPVIRIQFHPPAITSRALTNLNRNVRTWIDQNVPAFTESMSPKRHAGVVAKIDRLLKSQWPRSHVAMFGSAVSGLADANSDLDLTVLIPAEDVPVLTEQDEIERLEQEAQDKVDRQKRREKMREEGKEVKEFVVVEEELTVEQQVENEFRRRKGKVVTIMNAMMEEANKKKLEFMNILFLPKARVPIVKFDYEGLQCDIGVNNRLAVANSLLVRAYMEFDSRARLMVLLIKHWAKSRKINDPYRGTLSSYAYVMLVIHFLQVQQPPVLPNLQALGRTESKTDNMINGYDCYFYSDWRSVKPSTNQSTLGELLLGFFFYFSREFDYHDHVISIRKGGLLKKADKNWDPAIIRKQEDDLRKELTARVRSASESERAAKLDGLAQGQTGPTGDLTAIDEGKEEETKVRVKRGRQDKFWMCLEDPFEVSHNLCRLVDRKALYLIRGEFIKAHKVLAKSGKWLNCVRRVEKGFRVD
jgi:DNA polymerase sigma